MEDSADAYRRGDIENLAMIKEIWSDSGEIQTGYDYGGQHPDLDGDKMPPRPPVADGLGMLEAHVPPSLLPETVLQVIRNIINIPLDMQGVIEGMLPVIGRLLEDPHGRAGGLAVGRDGSVHPGLPGGGRVPAVGHANRQGG